MLLIWALFTFYVPAEAAPTVLKFIPQDNHPEVREKVSQFVESTLALLPAGLRPELPVVHFSDFGDEQINAPDCSDIRSSMAKHAAQRYGREINVGGFFESIQINRAFIQIILAGEASAKPYPCGHHDLYRLAQATLLHEVAHLIDQNKKISNNPQYTQLTKFYRKKSALNYLAAGGMIPGEYRSRNAHFVRSPDPYEFTSPVESFAVNFEYFILDDTFGCRRPEIYRYLSNALEYSPAQSCRVNTRIKLFVNDSVSEGYRREYDLDPARIYQIHYLFASQGDEFSSRWGHAMYRLVICAPSRTQVSAECLKDVEYHLVVSFRAEMNDVVLNQWKGIVGDYPSKLFILPFYQVIREYTKGELRDVLSAPLKIKASEQTDFILSVLDQYWTYRGKYKFFSNNCATESLALAKGSISSESLQKISPLTPRALFFKYIQIGLIDGIVFNDAKKAEAQGLWYRSEKSDLTRSYETVFGTDKTYRNFEDFYAKSRAVVRRAHYDSLDTSLSRKRVAAHFMILESQFKFRWEALLQKRLSEILQTQGRSEALQELKKQIEVQNSEQESQLVSGYGIPQDNDFKTVMKSESKLEVHSNTDFTDSIKEALRPEIAEYDSILQNIKFFRQEILKNN